MEFLSLNEIGKIGRGRSRHRPRNDPSLYGGDYPFLQTGDIKHSHLYVTKHSETYNEAGLSQSKLWPKGTLCITIAANIADTAILTYPACFPDSVLGFNVYKEKADVKYIKYCLDIYKQLMLNISLGTTQDNMSLEKLLKLKFPIPSLNTQQKISSIISTYDDLTENNNKRIKILENMAEELYREWFVRFRFPNWENTEFEKGVPKGWSYTILERLGKIRTGKTPSTSNSEFYGGQYPFYKTPDMHDKVFVFETDETLTEQGLYSQKSQIIEANAIMVTCIGSGGVTAISTKKGCTNQQINSLSVANNKFLYWAYYLIKYLKPQIELYGATGATMTNLSKGKFSNLEIVKPTDALIEQYFNLVSPKFEMIKKLSQMNQMLEEQKNSLLPRLISGKLSVEDLDIQFPPSMQEQ